METIYYGYVPLVYNWQLSEGCLRAALRASRGDHNNIFNKLLIIPYYRYYNLVLLVLTFSCNRLLSTISYFYIFILYILLI